MEELADRWISVWMGELVACRVGGLVSGWMDERVDWRSIEWVSG